MEYFRIVASLFYVTVLLLTEPTKAFPCNCDGKRLDCSNRNLDFLAQAITPALPCNGMKSLDVSENDLTSLDFPDTFRELFSVGYINASRNYLMTLDTLRGWKGKRLDVQYNKLRRIDISAAEEMEVLQAQNNGLKEILLSTRKCSLVIVRLQNNQLSSLPDGLRTCTWLSLLDVSNNQLSTLDLSASLHLDIIRADRNLLHTIEFPTDKCYLTRLSARFNRLSTLSEGILKCTNLEQLTVSNNEFSDFPIAAWRLLKLRQSDSKERYPEIIVDFRGNPVPRTKMLKAFGTVFPNTLLERTFAFSHSEERNCQCALIKLAESSFARVMYCITSMCDRYDRWNDLGPQN